jgi:hypothetical protein
MALEVIAKAVLTEMMGSIFNKSTTKIARDVIKTMYIGVEQVRKAKASVLRHEFDVLKFKYGESLDDFFVRIKKITHELAVLNDRCTEEELISKTLAELSEGYNQITVAIETLLDLSTYLWRSCSGVSSRRRRGTISAAPLLGSTSSRTSSSHVSPPRCRSH